MDTVKEFYSKPTYLSRNKVNDWTAMSTKRGGWATTVQGIKANIEREIAFRKGVMKSIPIIKGPFVNLIGAIAKAARS